MGWWLNITPKIWKYMGLTGIEMNKLSRIPMKAFNTVKWAGRISTAAFLVSGAISWAEIIDRTVFTSAAENSRMVGQERKSRNVVTRFSSNLGKWIGDWLYSEEDKHFRTPPEKRKFKHWTDIKKHQERQTYEAMLDDLY